MARKVLGLAEESQCAIFLSNFTECESVSLTRRGTIGRKLTWETVKQSLADGELDQVYQFQMKQQRQKRKARVVTEGAGINLQQLIADGIAKYHADQQKAAGNRVLTVTQPQAKAAKKVVEQVEDDDDDEEEEPVKLTKSQRKARNQAAGGQGSGKNAGVQAAAPAQVNANQASTSGMRKEALRRAELGPPPPAMFRLWQEEDVRSTIKVEELTNSESEEGIRREESVVIEEEEEEESYCQGRVIDTMERMEDLVEKMQRLNLKMRSICDEVAKPMVYLLGSETGPSSVKPACQTLGSIPRSGITFRPPRGQPTFPQAVCTRRKKEDTSSNQEPPSESQPREKEPVIDVGGEGKEDEEDERLRKEEEEQAAQRAKKRNTEERPEKAAKGESSRKQKYAIPLEDGLDIEALVDRLLEGHNDLLNLKDILASAPKLREGFKTRLSRRRVASVRLGNLIAAEAHWAVPGTKMDWKSVGTGSVNLSIKGKPCSGMLDTGAEMNIIKESGALRLGMDIDRMDSGFLYGASGKTPFTGTTSNVVIEIGKVKSGEGANEDIPPVDAFLDEEEDVKLHINAHAVGVSGVIVQGQSAFLAPAGYVKRADIVLKDFVEEDPWGGKEVEWMAKLALTETFQLEEDPLVIESGAYSLDTQAKYVADVSFLVNSIVQVHEDGEGSRDPVRDMEEDEFEEGKITEAFRADEYEGVYRELGLLLSCEMR
ncbi:hypothetical protein CBR_g2785 [Chara braunii]|uniref:Peptidase A2 domain-containing protein n=1 Tax=Chara braunii TaxID=69332 RepID=A0A388KDU9_CHABU|nr:hypothetical protein CBR_g2785 [Chara braunii]|eukprot:GBG68234.1 hypothetical protein CBR_g2785 [Chara braunii]